MRKLSLNINVSVWRMEILREAVRDKVFLRRLNGGSWERYMGGGVTFNDDFLR
jgi:hypothetical protein